MIGAKEFLYLSESILSQIEKGLFYKKCRIKRRKEMKRKKIVRLLAWAVIAMLGLAGCSSQGEQSSNQTNTNQEGRVYKIGISQLQEHAALDDARKGFEEGLKELGVKAEIEYQNAQGDIANTMSIAQKFVKDDVDLILAIATPAAQNAKQATASTEIPVLFTAVTDPVQSEIVQDWEKVGGNVTGTSDMVSVESQLEMFQKIDPNIKKIGILYNTSEANSGVQVKKVLEVAPKVGLKVETIGVNNINEMPQALDSLIKKVDALYMITDNMVASSVELVSKTAVENKMITIAAEDNPVKGGLLVTNGISYYELGKQTAQMAKEILVDGKEIETMPVRISKKTVTTYNKKILEALGLNPKLEVFKNAQVVGD